MRCTMNTSSPPMFSKLTTFSSVRPKIPHHSITTCCTSYSQESITTPKTTLYSVKFKTLKGCRLGISRYPDFVYDADGGLGEGTGTKGGDSKEISVLFDTETLYIPPLNSATTRFLGLPLPPFLKIEIVPEIFQGTIDEESGKVNLEFRAKFWFSVGSIYKAPPLVVGTILTSEESIGSIREGKGERLDEEGQCRLVGVATVDPIDDVFMNTFLALPTECLAEMKATVYLSAS